VVCCKGLPWYAPEENIFLASKYQRYFRLGCDAVWVGTEEGIPKYMVSGIRRQ
jgi:hypothetical protein